MTTQIDTHAWRNPMANGVEGVADKGRDGSVADQLEDALIYTWTVQT